MIVACNKWGNNMIFISCSSIGFDGWVWYFFFVFFFGSGKPSSITVTTLTVCWGFQKYKTKLKSPIPNPVRLKPSFYRKKRYICFHAVKLNYCACATWSSHDFFLPMFVDHILFCIFAVCELPSQLLGFVSEPTLRSYLSSLLAIAIPGRGGYIFYGPV